MPHYSTPIHRTLKEERPDFDFYETPANATMALLRNIEIPRDVTIWEPSVGMGAISNIIKELYPNKVLETDLIERGVGIGGVDFLTDGHKYAPKEPFWVITNPPYAIANEYIRKCFQYGAKKVIMLLRHAYSESSKAREDLLSGGHLWKELLIKERLKMHPYNHTGRELTSMYNHAWFIWDVDYNAPDKSEFIVKRISLNDTSNFNKRTPHYRTSKRRLLVR